MRKSDVVFFLSGAAALVEEVVWSRLLGRLLGSDAAGTGIVLGVFLVGLGAGALLLGATARRARDPRRLFLALEAVIFAWTLASPFVLAALAPVASTAARVGVAAGFLLVPTLAMGGTFPVMGRLAIRSAAEAGADTSRFYGTNTLGAALGALLAPFALMPALGLTGAVVAAAFLDLGAGVLALSLAAAPAAAAATSAGRARWSPLLAVPLLLGFASLAYEVAMVRILITLTGASVYAFAIVLAVYLLGIGVGSRLAAGWLAEAGTEGGPRAVLFRAAALAPLLAFGGLCVLRLKVGEPLGAPLGNIFLEGGGALQLWMSHAFLAVFALLLPAMAFGAALPAVVAVLVEDDPETAREPLLARVYAVNTLGATLGALIGTFLLLPLGAATAVRAGLLVSAVAAVPLARGRIPLLAGLWISAGIVQGFALASGTPEGLVAHEVGVQATATVTDVREDERTVRALRVNGKVVASTAPVDLRLQRLLGHVPGTLHGEVKSALVIGLGTGMTAGSLLDLPALERLDVVEISPAVIEAARSFAEWNGGLHDDPRVNLIAGDGRHHLLTTDAQYDLVTSDPIHPWTRGSSDLYAREHFARMAAHLAPGGIASQWLPLYQLSDEDVRTVVATWCAAFPGTAAWLTAYDLALVGWNDPPAGLAGWWSRPLAAGVRRGLAEAGIRSATELAALQVADDPSLRAFAGDAEPMVEDRPVLEFRAPKSFLAGYSHAALRWAGRREFVDRLPPGSRPRALEVRACLDRFLEREPQGRTEAARIYGEELLALPPVEAGD